MKMLIGGKWVMTNETIEVRDPFDNSLIDIIPKASENDALKAIV